MCGIAGFVDHTFTSTDHHLKLMTDVLSHRGPDDSGYYRVNAPTAAIGLGHRRLSIIDTSQNGHQPMHFKNWSITFNGEIYNYREIASDLNKRGYTFASTSDTEVVLKAFDCWGLAALHRFVGMFAFSMLDREKNICYLVRDRVGVKPLFYFLSPTGMLFASELKSFHQNPNFRKGLNVDRLGQYFMYGYIPSPGTIFKDTYKLPPGSYLEYNISLRSAEIHRYWNICEYYTLPKLDLSENEATNETERLLKSSLEYRMVSDVPVGMFLSGGYDSTTIAALLQVNRSAKIKTFTIGFNVKGFDEAVFAKRIAVHLGTDHTELYCTEKDAEMIVPELCNYYDEPFGDSSAIPTILVSRLARASVTVSLSADGGDELFGGYKKYHSALRALRRLSWIPKLLRPLVGRAIEVIPFHQLPLLNHVYRIKHFSKSVGDLLTEGLYPEQVVNYSSHHINSRDLQALFRHPLQWQDSAFSHESYSRMLNPLDAILAMDFQTYMVDDILQKVDRATMSASLEGREPLLDHRLAEFVAQLPPGLKIKNGSKKHLLKQIAHSYVPRELVDRPKSGFAVPVEHWFRDDLRNILEYTFDPERIKRQGLFDSTRLNLLKAQYLEHRFDEFEFIWSMIVFQLWYDRWLP